MFRTVPLSETCRVQVQGFILILLAICQQTCVIYTIAVYKVKNS